MLSGWIGWLALVLLLTVLMAGLGVLLLPRGRKARDLSRELTAEVEEWHHPERERQKHQRELADSPNA